MNAEERLIITLVAVCFLVAVGCYTVLIAPILWKKYFYMLIVAAGVAVVIGLLAQHFRGGSR